MKSLLMVAVLAVASFTAANAKSYHLTLTEPAMAGNVVLDPGDYSVKVEGNTAVFQNTDHGKRYTAPIRMEASAQKHEQTAVELNTQGPMAKVTAIELGGTNETVELLTQ